MNVPLPTSWLTRLGSLLFLVALQLPAWAQVDTYTFQATSGTFTALPATSTPVPVLLSDDVISGSLSIPFPFVFDGTTQNSFRASSNGFLSFNPSSTSQLGNGLATGAATSYPVIAPFWDDLVGSGTGARASYLTTGTMPNRVFTFEWLNWAAFGGTASPFSMQVKLYETTNRIEFVYQPGSSSPTGNDASIGLAGETLGTASSSFLSVQDASSSPATSSTTSNDVISDFPSSGQIYAFTPAPNNGCLPPRGLSVSDITGNTATIDFRGSATTVNFTVTYQATNGTVQTVTPPPSAGPIYLVGLALNTTYTVTVTANCSNGLTSSLTTTFTTSNGYCNSVGGTCGSDNITRVRVGGTTLNATNLTCSASGGRAYTNYPALGSTTATLLRGVTYVISAASSASGPTAAWIDLDHSFTFTADEYVQLYATGTSGNALFFIPNVGTGARFTYVGPTVMRVRSSTTTANNGSGAACANNTNGETKDFTINIGAAPSCLPASNLTATNVSTSSAQLNFTPGGTTGTYTIIYGPVGFDPTNPTTTGGITLTSVVSGTQLTGLPSGTGYDFYVSRDCGNGDLSVVTGPISFTTIITNTSPCTARALDINQTCIPLTTTSVGATTTTATGLNTTSCNGSNTNPRAVWFSFTTAAAGSPVANAVRLTVDGGPASQVQVFSATSCTGPFTSIACQGTAANTPAGTLDVQGLAANTTYYVRVFGFTSTATLGTFSICAVPVPNCAEPVALGADNITSTTANLTWASQPAATNSFLIKVGSGPFDPNTTGTAIGPVTTTNYQLNSLTPLTNYCFYVQRNCGGFNGSSIWTGPYCFSTVAGPPANDDPCGAIALAAGTNTMVTGTNEGATTSTQAGVSGNNCSPARQPTDVWYQMSPAAGSTSLTLTLTGTAAGAVRIFTAPNCATGPFTQVYCQSAGASGVGFSGPLTINGLTPGTNYYVSIAGYSSGDATGAFTLTAGPLGVLGSRAQAESGALVVYPNPSNTGQLTLRLDNQSTSGEATLLNALGQTVLVKTIAAGKVEHMLDTHGLATGVYTLRVRSGAQILTRKVVLE